MTVLAVEVVPEHVQLFAGYPVGRGFEEMGCALVAAQKGV